MNKLLRPTIIAGNWKMNKTAAESVQLINEMKPLVKKADCQIALCVPFTSLTAALATAEGSNIRIGAQNCHWETSGAYTGEISAKMLKSLGVDLVIVGHSERRQYFGETDETVQKRLRAALNAGMTVILCVGESLIQREQGVTEEVTALQTKVALGGVSLEELKRVVIAYEPVWAIGTGKTATAQQAQEVCAHIRQTVGKLYDASAAEGLCIQYGGSMNPKNAQELLEKIDVDGGLIGGASLKAADFAAIVDAAR